LNRLSHGALHSGEGTGERRFEDGSPVLDHYARKAAQDNLDAAQKVDATARAVDVAHPDSDALDGARILPEPFAESSPDVCPVIVVEADPVDSDIRGYQLRSGSTRRPLHGPRHLIREWLPLSNVSCADASA
jgi:hypothetical protein